MHIEYVAGNNANETIKQTRREMHIATMLQ